MTTTFLLCPCFLLYCPVHQPYSFCLKQFYLSTIILFSLLSPPISDGIYFLFVCVPCLTYLPLCSLNPIGIFFDHQKERWGKTVVGGRTCYVFMFMAWWSSGLLVDSPTQLQEVAAEGKIWEKKNNKTKTDKQISSFKTPMISSILIFLGFFFIIFSVLLFLSFIWYFSYSL